MNLQEQARALDALYAELPTIDCQGLCSSSCGPIEMVEPEWRRIQLRLGRTPRAISTTCPMLVRERCSVYALRPLICRLWGVVVRMPCPWGCEPSPRYLTTRESFQMLVRAEMIGASTDEALAGAQALLDRLDAATDGEIEASESYMIPAVVTVRLDGRCECGQTITVEMPRAQWEEGDYLAGARPCPRCGRNLDVSGWPERA